MSKSNKNLPKRKWIQLNIESVLGQSFQIFAAPYERVFNLKERIEYSKGISVSQQRLIWQSVELQDDMTVENLNLQDGAKLTLIPAMRGGPLNYRRVELKETLSPEILKKLTEVASEETNSNKAPLVVMVVHDGQLLNLFQLHDSDSSLESLNTSLFEYEEGSEEESDEEKQKKQENEQLHLKVAALRKKMDALALDKSKVDLPKPSPPKLNRESSIPKISQTTSARPAVHAATKPSNQRPDGASVAVRSTFASFHISDGKTSALLKQSRDYGTGSSFQKGTVQSSRVLPHENRRKSSVGSSQGGKVSSGRFGGSLPQMRTQRSLPMKVRRFSLPAKSSKQRESFDGSAYRNRNSILSDDFEAPAGLNSSSYKALNDYLKLTETFPGGSRYNHPLQVINSEAISATQGSLNPVVASSRQESQVSGTVADQKAVTRCALCSKKTGLATTFTCRCEKTFCTAHRYPEAHNCAFDYKSEGRKEIEENNPLVVAPKLPKI